MRKALLEAVEAEMEKAIATAEETRKGATHEESRPENDKDTRGLEASYLARGQAMRVEELGEALTRLRWVETKALGPDDPIGLGALVDVEDEEGEVTTYFLVPVEGGRTLEVGGVTVKVITPAAPFGRALVGLREGDDFELRLRGEVRELVIDKVR